MDYNDINKRILELCKEKNWSEYKLSQESNIPNSSINAMFKHNHVPTIHNLKKICDAFQITLSQFFDNHLFNTSNNTSLYIELWNQLNINDQEKVLIYMHGLLHKEMPKEDFNNDIWRIEKNSTTAY